LKSDQWLLKGNEMSTIQTQVTGRAAFSIPEVMSMTGLGRDKVYAVINEGLLAARKCGRRTLIMATDLQKFLEALPTIAGKGA
jgi:excisionase family DNA binding protein